MKIIVRIADGSLLTVASTGSVIISENITLTSVLPVLNLDCNLFSISKLARELNCVTKFLPNFCEFQDLDSRTIGSAEMCLGLYLLKVNNSSRRQTYKAECAMSKSQSSKVLVMYFIQIMIVLLCCGTIG